jgi:thiamine-phosphate pyrophosphorylase
LKRYYITDRHGLGETEALLACIARNLNAGVENVQIREKDLSGAELAALVRSAIQLKVNAEQRILVNERMDVAIACGADGVHLTSDSVPVDRIRQHAPAGFIIGVSTHSQEECVAAELGGADFVVFGPVFAPLSKASPLEPRGLRGLQSV